MGVRVPPSAHFKYKKLKINKKKISNTESSIDIIIENKDYINPFESKLKELKKRVGVSLNPETNVDVILDNLNQIDLVQQIRTVRLTYYCLHRFQKPSYLLSE